MPFKNYNHWDAGNFSTEFNGLAPQLLGKFFDKSYLLSTYTFLQSRLVVSVVENTLCFGSATHLVCDVYWKRTSFVQLFAIFTLKLYVVIEV